MIPNKPTSSPLTLPITTKTSSTTGCNGSDKPEVHKIIGHSSQDKLFAELLAAGKVKRVPENGSFAVTESNNENVILTNTEFLPESILKDPNSIIAGKSIYTILKKILSTIKFDPIVNIGSKRTESFKFQTNGGLLVNIKKIDQFYITGSYIWKLLSTNSESLNLIFKDLFATQSDSTSSFISAAFKNTQFCAGLATEIDIRVDTKTPNEELNSFLSSKLRDVVEKEYQKEVTKFSRFNGSTLVGFKTCNSHIEVFFTGEYDNPISSLSSFYLCLKFNENKDNFEIVFPKNPHYDRMDLFVAMGCLINIPNLNNPVPAFCRCMRDNSVTAEGYLEHLIKILFNKDSQQDQDNALKAVSILETVLQKNITFNGDLEKDYEHQKIFSLIWNTLQNLIHHEVINENSAQKILSRLQDLESFKAIEQKPLMKILTTQQGKYTISELFSAVEILTFLYFPSSATIRQKPLQYVVEKGLNIKFAANLKRSLEKIYSLYCRDKASTLIPDLLDLFCQSAGKELAIDQKFYDFILTNLSDKLTADEVLECATNFFEHENAHISLLGANLILICLKFSKPDSKKIPSQIVTKVLTYIPLNSSLLNLFYLNITKFLNIVPDCNINLSSYDFWLDLFLSNSLTQEASNIWEQNKTLFHKDAPKNIYTTANFQSDQIPALQFAIKFYQEINISPDGLLSVLKKNRSNLKLVFKKYPEQLINYIQSAKKDYKDALELLLYIDNDSYIFKFILSQKLDLNEIPLETKQKVPAVVNMLSDLDLLKLELGQKLQGLIVDCIDSVKLAHLNLVISYYSPFYQLSAIDLEVEICDEVLKKLNSISDALAQHYKIKCLPDNKYLKIIFKNNYQIENIKKIIFDHYGINKNYVHVKKVKKFKKLNYFGK